MKHAVIPATKEHLDWIVRNMTAPEREECFAFGLSPRIGSKAPRNLSRFELKKRPDRFRKRPGFLMAAIALPLLLSQIALELAPVTEVFA
jgi:hypothetical protein